MDLQLPETVIWLLVCKIERERYSKLGIAHYGHDISERWEGKPAQRTSVIETGARRCPETAEGLSALQQYGLIRSSHTRPPMMDRTARNMTYETAKMGGRGFLSKHSALITTSLVYESKSIL